MKNEEYDLSMPTLAETTSYIDFMLQSFFSVLIFTAIRVEFFFKKIFWKKKRFL